MDDTPEPSALRCPPVPAIVQEYDASAGYRIGRQADGILRFVFVDFLRDTVEGALAWNLDYQDRLRTPERHLIDARETPAEIPVYAIQALLRAFNHPSSRHIRLAILMRRSAAATLLDTVARVAIGVQARLFTDEDEALAWLTA